MAVKRKKGMRVNYLIIFLSGLVLLVAGILVYLLIIKGVYGKYKIEEILPTEENLGGLLSDKGHRTAVLFSEYTQNMLPEGSTWLNDNVDTWETFLGNMDLGYDLISDEDVELGKISKYSLVILPGSKAISDLEIIQIKKYLERGGSIFATSGTASYSNEAKWRGWNFFTEVYGLKFTKEIDPKKDKFKIHTLRGNLPLTGNIPTGYTLNVATWDRPIYAEVLEPRTTQVSFWFDFRKESGLVREQVKKSAGIVYGTYGKGRFVWYGFELNSVIGEQEDYIYFDKLFQNSIRWLKYEATGYVKDWPAPYESAVIFVPTLTNEIGNIKNLTSLLGSQHYPATFFIDPFVAAQKQALTRSIAKYGDVGAITDVGFLENSHDTTNHLYDEDSQYSNILVSTDTLTKITGMDVKGIMPLFGFYDENTLQAMEKADLDYLVVDSLTDRSVPRKYIRGTKNIMVITKTARDDIKIIGEYGLTEPKFQLYTYEEDVDRLLFEGGLYVLKLHTDYQLKPQYVGVIKDLMKYIRKKKKIWITSISELQDWWFRRSQIEIRYETRSKRRIAVQVHNPKDMVVNEFVVQLDMNKPVKDIEISSDIINMEIPEYEFDSLSNTLYLYVYDLEPNETRQFFVDFDNIPEE
ncbi:MAG: hypothetical protein GXO87_04970 [Chlorobi bacterium]|nr:hypothetical protein [Chlorobiota bacterium]